MQCRSGVQCCQHGQSWRLVLHRLHPINAVPVEALILGLYVPLLHCKKHSYQLAQQSAATGLGI